MFGRKLTKAVGVLLAALLISGCGAPFIELSNDQGYSDATLASNSDDPYVRVWQSMRLVLEHEFGANNVHVSTYPERQWRTMYVHSRLNGLQATLQRMEIQAYVTRDKYNENVPQVVVWHQAQMGSNPRPSVNPLFGGASGHNRVWTNLARNDKMEARLTNLVYEALEGPKAWSGRYGLDSKPWIDWEASAPAAIREENGG